VKISSTRNIIVEISCAISSARIIECYNLGVILKKKKKKKRKKEKNIIDANVPLREIFFIVEFMHVIINCRLPDVQVEVPSLGSGE